MELTDIDLNQLVLFQRLMMLRSVTRVAESLGLTQPAVSNALARLRRQLGDALFVRTPSGMVPTPYAEQLARPVAAALELIHGGLNRQPHFDPAHVKRSMTIGMTDIGEIVFLPALVQRVGREAPGVALSTVRDSTAGLRDDMESGRVDLAIGLLPQLRAGFHRRTLFRQRYVCLFRKGHRLDRPAIALTDFRAAEHLLVVAAGTGHGDIDALMRRAGVERRIRLTVPHFVAVGHILQGTDLVATVTERLAQQLAAPFGLTHVAHPMALPEVAIDMFWHARAHRAPDNQWLRGIVFELFGDVARSRPAPRGRPAAVSPRAR